MKIAFALFIVAAFVAVSSQSKTEDAEREAIRSLVDSLSRRLENLDTEGSLKESNRGYVYNPYYPYGSNTNSGNTNSGNSNAANTVGKGNTGNDLNDLEVGNNNSGTIG